MRLAYPVEIKTRNGVAIATFTDLPDLSARAGSRRHAIDAARVALVETLHGYAREHRDMPRPSPGRLRDLVDVPLLIAAKAALYQTMRDQNVSNVALAQRLNTVEGTVRRLVDLGHRSHVDQVEAALQLLGKRLIVDLHVR